ncbi:hypothetical protein PVK06_026880 [Gossypium arboreum]|uniref:Uncharacterized protein n=1 Tax=Gossypium arboreum TaxID=29729 RepID=A0ABR0P1S4_GOSAR|nr:hypothetical protein PVK06_026880 [Gossypium arboreum]
MLIIDGYWLTDYVSGNFTIPLKFVLGQERKLISNLDFALYQQQDKILVSWLLPTASSDMLSSFKGANTAHEVWSKACLLFVTASNAKVSRLKHTLHSLKKGNPLVKEYLAKINGICDLLAAFGHSISNDEQVEIILASLSVDFESVLTIASFASESLCLD